MPRNTGGLPTPRPSAEIVGGNGDDVLQGTAKVIEIYGKDVTEQYIAGAMIALEQLKQRNISLVVLKANSPSCGSKQIYSGSFDGTVKEGFGVCTALFRQHNIKVLDENHPSLINEIENYLLIK